MDSERHHARYDKLAYKGRNVVERCFCCFCRLKDFRRIATRYDKLARNVRGRRSLSRAAPSGCVVAVLCPSSPRQHRSAAAAHGRAKFNFLVGKQSR